MGCFIYLSDLCVKIAYFKNTKWISTEIRDLWIKAFEIRPLFVLGYHAFFVIFSYERSYYEYNKERKNPSYQQVKPDERRDTDPDAAENEAEAFTEEVELAKIREAKHKVARSTLQRLCEITLQAILLPLIMYSGFSRLASLRDIKTNYLYISLGQEILFHQVPLIMIYFYNNSMLDKPYYVLDEVVFYVALVHVGWVFFEMSFFRGYLNKGINLE